MALPLLLVQIAFGFGPYDAPIVGSGDWVDVTDDVYEVTINRGRSSEFEDFPASTCTIGLFNDERQYDPLNTAGTYYGQLVANVPVQVRATIGMSTYTVWRGLIDGWPATYTEAGFRAEIQLACTDAFKVLAERPMPDTYRQFLDTLDAPSVWYRCDSIADARLVNSGSRGRDAVVIPGVLDTTDPLVPVSARAIHRPLVELLTSGESLYPIRVPIVAESFGDNMTAGATWSVSMVCQIAHKNQGCNLFALALDPTSIAAVVSLSTVAGTGQPALTVDLGGPDLFVTPSDAGYSGSDISDGQPHHLVAVRDSTSLYLYQDGQLIGSDFDAAATGAYDGSGGEHRIAHIPTGGTPYRPPVSVDEIMSWEDRALDATEVADLYSQLTAGFSGPRLSGQAVTDILDEIGWPASLRQIDTGEVIVNLPVNPVGVSTLALLQNVARCEGGRLFIDRQGRVAFHGRSRFITETVESTVQYTFSDQDRDDPTPPDVGLLDGTLSITVDDRITYDAAEITRTGGIAQRTALSATPARTYSASDLLLASDVQALSLAQWIPFRFGATQPRSEAWRIDPEIRPADWGDLLGLEIGHRIGHDITPGGIGSAIALEQHLSVIGHDITPERWLITLNGTPTDPNEAAYFLWAATETADDDNGWADTDGDPPGGYWG